jgi:hypothetical protein
MNARTTTTTAAIKALRTIGRGESVGPSVERVGRGAAYAIQARVGIKRKPKSVALVAKHATAKTPTPNLAATIDERQIVGPIATIHAIAAASPKPPPSARS